LLRRVWWGRRNVARCDRHFGELDHDGGALSALVWGRWPEQQRPCDRAISEQDNGSAHQPAHQVSSIFNSKCDHGSAAFSNPTRATLKWPAVRRRFITSISSP